MHCVFYQLEANFLFIFFLGIRKHALDRPFTKTTGIDPDKKKGSKRSRRRAGFENRDKKEEEKEEEAAGGEMEI